MRATRARLAASQMLDLRLRSSLLEFLFKAFALFDAPLAFAARDPQRNYPSKRSPKLVAGRLRDEPAASLRPAAARLSVLAANLCEPA